MSAHSPASGDFGPNEWLVEEMYEQYTQDPDSVDAAWQEVFAKRGATPSAPEPSPAPAPAPAEPESAKAESAKPAAEPQAAEPGVSQPEPQPTKPEVYQPAQPEPGASEQAATPTGDAKPATIIADPQPDSQGSAINEGTPGDTAAYSPAGREPRSGVPVEPTAVDPIAQAAADPAPVPRDLPKPPPPPSDAGEASTERLRGVSARVVTNMEDSLAIPTATSVRAIPAKAMIDNRTMINEHLRRTRGGKVSFTHLIGYAVVRALDTVPDMNVSYALVDGKPGISRPAHVNFGLAIDLPKDDGSRQLVVPNIKGAERMDFAQFWRAYEDVVRKARGGKLEVSDFQGTTISLTNPGGIGTVHSVPRLMNGQGTIIGVGALEYPAEWQGASQESINRHAISKVTTLTSTYDHRIIQGAASGEFLRRVADLLLGADDFYREVFTSLRIPYEPVFWSPDISTVHESDVERTTRVHKLIHAYRVRGHLLADTDPLEYRQRTHADVELASYGLTLWDLDREFATGGFGGTDMMSLRKIISLLQDTYCRSLGLEYMHIQDPEQREWFQEHVERDVPQPSSDEQLRILRKLGQAEAFETFLQTKFVGQKRFSLEGGEAVIPLLDKILIQSVGAGMDEVCIGMPHRGRLNVLANIAGKSYGQIFKEFEGHQDHTTVQGSGDVKYHLGTEGEFVADNGERTKVYLAANPSHLEAVNPVLEGVVRAKQDRINLGSDGFTVLPILLHGDAAFAGQGVVSETLNLSQLRGYRTGGTIHVVINNQVGFTTAPAHSRSSVYCTDIARMIQAPILHVNGDDPQACVRAAQLAFEYRQQFAKDVVIDLVCYRRRGHNEGDDPSMTQPLMYNLIEAKRSTRKLYSEALIGRGDITQEQADEALAEYQATLERAFTEVKEAIKSGSGVGETPGTDTVGHGGLERPASQVSDDKVGTRDPRETSIPAGWVTHITGSFDRLPEGFHLHPKLAQAMAKRAQMGREGGIDWATGELLAFGSLLMEGVPVRLSGQDSRRGTFVQRHAVLIDRNDASEWTPLHHLSDEQARFWVYDSLLSEYAALGFEYGYSVERADALVLWEAQFGDFVNGAQTIIDEFISSSEQKWGQRSSVVMLLPHGYEGQGPDHSSARIERFLTLFAENNMTIAHPSSPANYFHLLRRHAYARPRKPLVVFTPKSMLRLRAASAAVEDFTTGTFRPVLPDPVAPNPQGVRRVLLASGKLVHELDAERAKREDSSVAILRLEQYAPFPAKEVVEAVAAYPDAELVWVQDEPRNQGGWPFIMFNAPEMLEELGEKRALRAVTRSASASPSTGSTKRHAEQQKVLLNAAFGRD